MEGGAKDDFFLLSGNTFSYVVNYYCNYYYYYYYYYYCKDLRSCQQRWVDTSQIFLRQGNPIKSEEIVVCLSLSRKPYPSSFYLCKVIFPPLYIFLKNVVIYTHTYIYIYIYISWISSGQQPAWFWSIIVKKVILNFLYVEILFMLNTCQEMLHFSVQGVNVGNYFMLKFVNVDTAAIQIFYFQAASLFVFNFFFS